MRSKYILIATVLAALGGSTGGFLGPIPSAGAATLAAKGRTWYVSATATSDPTCSAASKKTPFATIAGALDCAQSGDTVHVGPGSFPGGITISADITLTGAGANTTTIANPASISVPEVTVADQPSVTISNLTIDGAASSGTPPNEGILAGGGTLVLDKVAVVNTLDTHDSTAAAVDVEAATAVANVTVLDSTIADNSTLVGQGSGGVFVNTSASLAALSTLEVANSTIAGNVTVGAAGGIGGSNTDMTLVNDTVTGNSGRQAGGVLLSEGSVLSVLSVTSTILAGNSGPTETDCGRQGEEVTGSNDIVGIDTSGASSCGFVNGVDGNIVGTSSAPVNAELGPLAANGGPTETEALLPGSPAIGTGSAAACEAAPVNDLDQRGSARDATSRLVCDMGAYDTGGRGRTWYVSASATSDPACSAASKKKPFATIAGALACARSGDTVHVGPGSFAGGITISADITLTGAGANTTTIANPASISVPEVTVADQPSVTISNLTIDGAASSGDPANEGILAAGGTLVLDKITVVNTFDTDASTAAAVDVEAATAVANVTVLDSTIADNSAFFGSGSGGVYVNTSASLAALSILQVANSTIAGNVTVGAAGGIGGFNTDITLVSDTVTGNQGRQSGGVFLSDGSVSSVLSVTNTILAGNSGPTETDCGRQGEEVTGSNDIVGIDTPGVSSCGFVNDVDGNIVGTSSAPVNPELGPLAANGGPTETEALLPGSPAIGTGNAAACEAAPVNDLDQRGSSRDATSRLVCDMGAYDTGGAN